MVVVVVGGGGGVSLCPPSPHHTNVCKIRDLKELCFRWLWWISVKFNNFTNFKALFPGVCQQIFPNYLGHVKDWKNRGKVYWFSEYL